MSRALLESILRAHPHGLARTLVAPDVSVPLPEPLATGVAPLDTLLGGGFPRGHLSQVVGPRSSGRRAVVCATLAAATRRGELVAIVDAFDTFDPASAHQAGVMLERTLWVRGSACGVCLRHGRDGLVCAVERAIAATGLVLEAGGFGVVVLDFGDAPALPLRRWPIAAWLRMARALEGGRTVGLVVSSTPLWRSAGGVTLTLRPAPAAACWSGGLDHARVLRGLQVYAALRAAPARATPVQEVLLTIEMAPDRLER
jgi:hypothetical protein